MANPTISTQAQGQTIEARIGKLSFTHDFANGYAPTEERCNRKWILPDFEKLK